MTFMDWMIITGVSASIIFLIVSIIYIIRFAVYSIQLAKFPQIPRKKKAQKRWRKFRRKIQGKRRSAIKKSIALSLVTISVGAATSYAIYYQSTNLTTDDTDSIVTAHSLLVNFQSELDKISNQSEDNDTAIRNLNYLGTRLASFATKTASQSNTVEGQKLLNRYYYNLSDVGINLSRESAKLPENSDLIDTYNSTIAKLQDMEGKVFSFYSLDASNVEEDLSN